MSFIDDVFNQGWHTATNVTALKINVEAAQEALRKLDQLADEIEQTLQNEMEREIPSTEIGELVMDKLKDVDEVAYVRFASVYRSFKDINTFMEELTKLLKQKDE